VFDLVFSLAQVDAVCNLRLKPLCILELGHPPVPPVENVPCIYDFVLNIELIVLPLLVKGYPLVNTCEIAQDHKEEEGH
jgi:hypothetical protein